MLKLLHNLFSFARQNKELLVLFKSKEWVYVGSGNPYDTMWLDVVDYRYIVSVSFSTVHVTMLDRETGKFDYNYELSPKSWFFNALDMQVFIRCHRKMKKAMKHAKEEQDTIRRQVLHV